MSPNYEVLMPLAPWEDPHVLAEALESIRRQSVLPRHVVISCDGCPPQPLQEVLASCGLPLKVIVGPGSEGVGPVLARGLEHCRCDLIVRADSDDISMPQRCELQVQEMAKRPHLAALSTPILEFITTLGESVSERSVPISMKQITRYSRWRNPLNHPAAILRRSRVLPKMNYRSKPGFEDYDLWLRLLKAGEAIDNLSQPLVWARVGPKHLARRRGWRYAVLEIRFLLGCGREQLLPWPHVILMLLIRCPMRILPPSLQLAASRPGYSHRRTRSQR